MEIPARRIAPMRPFLAGFLAWAVSGAGGFARGQTPAADAPGPTGPPARKEAAPAPAKAKAQAQGPRREPSAAHKESIRKTVEKRRQRRARRAQVQGLDGPRPVGAVVPWPMPPALIIRQTPQVHDEVGSLLDVLRRAR